LSVFYTSIGDAVLGCVAPKGLYVRHFISSNQDIREPFFCGFEGRIPGLDFDFLCSQMQSHQVSRHCFVFQRSAIGMRLI